MFVSDAMIQDLADGLDALALAGGAAAKLGAPRRGPHRRRRADPQDALVQRFEPSCTRRCPPTCASEAGADGPGAGQGGRQLPAAAPDDAHWPPTTPFADAGRLLPRCRLTAFRTLKGEIIVGSGVRGQAERLAEEDPAWLVNGQRGVIQARL